MPYALRHVKGCSRYYVFDRETGERVTKRDVSYRNALAQVRALHAAERAKSRLHTLVAIVATLRLRLRGLLRD